MHARRVVAGGLVLGLAALPAHAQTRVASPVPARVRAELAAPVSDLRVSMDTALREGDAAQAQTPGGNQRFRMAGPNTAGVVVTLVAMAAATIVLMLVLRKADSRS